MPTIIDLSPTISPETPVWPGDPAVRLIRPASLARGDAFTLTELAMSAHTGSHVDAPAHYVRGGAGVDAMPLDALVGPALVVDTGDADAITAGALAGLNIPSGTERLLFRTKNSARGLMAAPDFHTDFVAITADGAEWLVEQGVRLVGMDYYSVAPYDALAPTHQILLRAGVVIVEGLNLIPVQPGPYTFICLPLKLKDADGAPARAILITP
jgi:arylformamidase